MELDEVFKARRSTRHFGDEAVGADTIAALIAAAGRAPSAGNRQPWKVEALAPGAARGLADAVEGKAWEILYPTLREVIARDTSVLGRSPTGRELTDATVAFVDREILLRGSFWLLVVHFPRHTLGYTLRTLASTADFVRHRLAAQRGLAARLELARFLSARAPQAIECDLFADVGSVAGFMYGLSLAATDLGLASCIQYTYGLVQPEVRAHLGIDAGQEILGAVAIGTHGRVDDDAFRARVSHRRPVSVTWHGDDGRRALEPVDPMAPPKR